MNLDESTASGRNECVPKVIATDPTPFPQTDSDNVPAPVRPGLRTAFLLRPRVVSFAIGLLLVTCGGVLQGDPRPNAKQDRIAGLVSQLGDAKYVKREA